MDKIDYRKVFIELHIFLYNEKQKTRYSQANPFDREGIAEATARSILIDEILDELINLSRKHNPDLNVSF